jgi:hypothetical protein
MAPPGMLVRKLAESMGPVGFALIILFLTICLAMGAFSFVFAIFS